MSVSPWKVRAVEIRGTAELLVGGRPLAGSFGPEAVRIHPRKILSRGLEDAQA